MYKPAKTSLQGRTIDILNIIRQNASHAYQDAVPEISDVSDIPAVGQAIVGNPTRSNEFINALVNRIGLVLAESAIFNNPYEMLKKGYLEYGESVEEIFIGLAKVLPYSAEKAAEREFKRTIPDVKSVFHIMNWKVVYPVTVQPEELKRAFLSADGVERLITGLIDSIYTAAAYDEFLLVKYLLIKNVTNGSIKPVQIAASDMKDAAIKFRGTSNAFTFISGNYNFASVPNNAPKENQYIFMDSTFNAAYDVEVLAAAFNMDKADFMGRLLLIDDFTTFDNARWEVIRDNSDMVEEVTAAELALMADVKAVILDEDWFQVYDNNNKFTEKYVASGLYWNYFYHTWKTVSWSPYANALVFVDDGATVTAPASVAFTVQSVVNTGTNLIVTLAQTETDTVANTNLVFVQDADTTEDGVAVHPYGAIILPITPASGSGQDAVPASVPSTTLKGKIGTTGYTASAAIDIDIAAGDTVTMAKDA